MHIRELSGRTVCILGFGREGRSALRALERFVPRCDITVADRNPELKIRDARCKIQNGSSYLDDLNHFDVLIKSPGIPPHPKLSAQRAKLTNATQIFLDTVAEDGAAVIGVTGSKGKSTTASLIHACLEACERPAVLAGNIGTPALDALDASSAAMTFVLEMSSYQLMDMTASPHLAVITSFFPEHLDYHGTLADYLDAKKHITRFQTEQDAVFYNGLSPCAKDIAEMSPGERIPFSPDDAPVAIAETRLLGDHNRSNISAAWKVSRFLNLPGDLCLDALRDFQGLPHRLQFLGDCGGITWVDDAISTTPESSIAALDALGDRVATILLGGQDRGSNFTALAERIARSDVRHVILFPGSGPRIRQALHRAGAGASITDATTMDEAVAFARAHTPRGTVCLLSPASPSYGMFRNFEEKGAAFARCIGNEQTEA